LPPNASGLYGDGRMNFKGTLALALILERERLQCARKQLFVVTGISLSDTDGGSVEFA
jgi:hypothetical protein